MQHVWNGSKHFGIEAADFKMSRFVRLFCLLKSKEDRIFNVRKDARVTDIQREFGTSFAQF
ncbi:MAG: hypothetical protein ACJ71M_01835 [Nitrososphaeraceae archaeon]